MHRREEGILFHAVPSEKRSKPRQEVGKDRAAVLKNHPLSCRLFCPSADRLPNPRILQKLSVPIIDTPKCNLLYSKDTESIFQPKTIKDDMLCAGFAEGKKDACKVGAGMGHAGG